MSDRRQNADFVQKFDLEALESNSVLEHKWTQYKKEYEELKSCLEEFPKELSAPILMPIGSKIFVRAKLCNTNEVFIRYGEIFTKQTAFEARAVCERHIKRCDEMLASLTKEKNWLSDRFCAKQEIIADSEQMTEIVEPYDPEKEAAWNEIHRQKVREYKQQLAKNKIEDKEEDKFSSRESVKKSNTSEKKITINDLLTRRVSLEIPNNNDVCGDSDDCSTNDSYEDDEMDDEDDDDDDEEDDEEEEDDIDDEDDDSKLEIVFTNDVPETTKNPSKKIKKRVSFNNDVQVKEFQPRPEEHFIRRREEISEETENPEVLVTEIQDIVERVSGTCLENEVDDEENTRPVSKFRAMRNKRNYVK